MRLLAICLTLAAAAASDWPRFRGPNGSGVSPDQALPAEIGPDRNVLWSVKTPKGNSSPIVAGGRLWITGHEGDQRSVLCYDARTGALLWRRAVTKAFDEAINPINGPTTPTPATDGRSVFVFFPDAGLFAFDLDGKERWRVPLGPLGGVQGMAASPIYAEGNVVLLIDTPEQAWLAAFDAATGEQVWKVDRPPGFLGSYTTPAVYKQQIVVAGATELTSYQAATGERLWWARGVTYGPAAPPLIVGDSIYTVEPVGPQPPPFSQMLQQFDKNKTGRIDLSQASGDTVNDKIMYRLFKSADKISGNGDGLLTEDEWKAAFSSSNGGLVRTRLNGRGDVTESHIVWRYTKGLPYLTGALLYNDVLYLIREGGILSTFNPATGALLRQERLKDAIGDYYASPVAADGKIYFASKDGKVTVIAAGADWKPLATADLREQIIAAPAIADSRLYIRTEAKLYCFRSGVGQALSPALLAP